MPARLTDIYIYRVRSCVSYPNPCLSIIITGICVTTILPRTVTTYPFLLLSHTLNEEFDDATTPIVSAVTIPLTLGMGYDWSCLSIAMALLPQNSMSPISNMSTYRPRPNTNAFHLSGSLYISYIVLLSLNVWLAVGFLLPARLVGLVGWSMGFGAAEDWVQLRGRRGNACP